METTVLERVKRAINYLIFIENLENDKELAKLMGYASAYLSHVKTGKVALSEKFIKKLCSMDENIDKNYILTGEGSLLKNDQIERIKALEREMSVKDELVTSLKEQIILYKTKKK
ncbi:hypothetical protein QP519_09375 [Weeksella virosa]|uniref:hypothetical protein n=1 Tax=Weeksella virosa TaxID=1014 RepID=UPI002554F0BA|nr:hypothetical protein [Weeksella virosa]MDK7375743.1 hypothetical protein [Weeksella virosa]